MNLRVVGSALIALACSQPYSATAQSKLDPEVLAEFGGTYSTDCAGRVATRLRVESQSLVVERGTPLLSGSNVSTSYSYFGRSSPKGFLVALQSSTQANQALNFLIFREGNAQWAMVTGAPGLAGVLGGSLASQKFLRCTTNVTERTATSPSKSLPPAPAPSNSATSPSLKPAGNSIEITDLIRLFLVDASASHTNLDWNDPVFRHPALKWSSTEVRELPYKPNMDYMYERKGTVMLVSKGKAIYVAQGKPVPATIVVGGARTMVGFVGLASNFVTHENESADLGLLRGKPYRCKSGMATFSQAIDQINVPGKKPAWLQTEVSCGSAGCGFTYNLFLSKQQADKVECS